MLTVQQQKQPIFAGKNEQCCQSNPVLQHTRSSYSSRAGRQVHCDVPQVPPTSCATAVWAGWGELLLPQPPWFQHPENTRQQLPAQSSAAHCTGITGPVGKTSEWKNINKHNLNRKITGEQWTLPVEPTHLSLKNKWFKPHALACSQKHVVLSVSLLLPGGCCSPEHRDMWTTRKRVVCCARVPIQAGSRGSAWTMAQAKQQLIY